jgi:hypothetical protein
MITTPPPATTSHQQDMLNDLANLGHRLARLVVEQAEAGTIPALKASVAFDNVTRSIRRCLWLAHELAKPAKTTNRIAARKRILRQVEDAIQRNTEDDAAEVLHEELRDRLDSPDLDDEIGARPIDDIIADIVRDLGLASTMGITPWKRRTPADLEILSAHAAQHPRRHHQASPNPTGCNSS